MVIVMVLVMVMVMVMVMMMMLTASCCQIATSEATGKRAPGTSRVSVHCSFQNCE
jgi:hypothetical protein